MKVVNKPEDTPMKPKAKLKYRLSYTCLSPDKTYLQYFYEDFRADSDVMAIAHAEGFIQDLNEREEMEKFFYDGLFRVRPVRRTVAEVVAILN